MAMAADPHHYDHDEVHGPVLRELQRRAGSMVDAPPRSTTASIDEVFQQLKMKKKSREEKKREKEKEHFVLVGGHL